jgi:hypothetical protein
MKVLKQKGYPYSPCNKCLVRATCNKSYQLVKCPELSDYCNANIHKDPDLVCTFSINCYGVWESFLFNGSKNCTIEELIQASIGESLMDGPVFDCDKYLEYTKHLESLEYYDLL